MAHILIVEDDIDIATGIAEYLEIEGHQLDFAYNGEQAVELLSDIAFDMVLLDINLPYLSGIEVCKKLLHNTLASVPVIMMTAQGSEQDVLTGFASGAWDYIIKPFSFAELSARIKVCLAKAKTQPKATLKSAYGDAELDHNTFIFSYLNKELQMHQVGFDILQLLIANAPNVVKSQTIQTQLWGELTPQSDPLRAHIYKLRKQLKTEFGQPFIETVKGVGYRFAIN